MGDEHLDDGDDERSVHGRAPEADEADEDGPAGHVLPDEVEYPHDGEAGSALPPRVERWRRRSATGAMLTGFAFGLREVLEPKRNEPAIMLETSGVPPKDLPVEADLDNVPPRQSVVKIRRWLLGDGAAGTDTEPGASDAARAAGHDDAAREGGTDGPTTRAATSVPARSRRPAPRPNVPRRAKKKRR